MVVWGSNDYSFSAAVAAVSVSVWFCTPPQQMLWPPLKWIVTNSCCAALRVLNLKESGPYRALTEHAGDCVTVIAPQDSQE